MIRQGGAGPIVCASKLGQALMDKLCHFGAYHNGNALAETCHKGRCLNQTIMGPLMLHCGMFVATKTMDQSQQQG